MEILFNFYPKTHDIKIGNCWKLNYLFEKIDTHHN